jgi:hypothetical protein
MIAFSAKIQRSNKATSGWRGLPDLCDCSCIGVGIGLDVEMCRKIHIRSSKKNPPFSDVRESNSVMVLANLMRSAANISLTIGVLKCMLYHK